jgi:hypothetical protein
MATNPATASRNVPHSGRGEGGVQVSHIIRKAYTAWPIDRTHIIHTRDVLLPGQILKERHVTLYTVDQPLEVVPDDRWMKRDARHG